MRRSFASSVLIITMLSLISAGPALAGSSEDVIYACKCGDNRAAYKIMMQLAEGGGAVAQKSTGRMYLEGQGVRKEYTEAVKWYRKSAEQGNTDSKNGLGHMCFEGQGVQRNYDENQRWGQEWTPELIAKNTISDSVNDTSSNHRNCVWRPTMVTQCKIKNISEERPYFMEDMQICSDTLDRKKEKSKWSWLYPTKLDLIIFAELIGCRTQKDLDNALLSSGYSNVNVNTSAMQKKENTVNNIFTKVTNECKYTTIQSHQIYKSWDREDKKEKLENYKGNVVWISAYWKCSQGEKAGYQGSWEVRINCDKKTYQMMDDYWDRKGNGWTLPDFYNWRDINNVKPFSGNIESHPIKELYNGFCSPE